jgi:lysophospholipid acyltransferase (LPLAT)-like uncharacterized protein
MLFVSLTWIVLYGTQEIQCVYLVLAQQSAQVQIVHQTPHTGMLKRLFGVLGLAIRSGFDINAARASVQESKHGRTVSWDNAYVLQLQQALKACRVW